MTTSIAARSAALVVIVATLALPGATRALSTDVEKALASSKYVYISTERKDHSYGKPAEIWFLYDQGAVWVASPPSTWRVKRIKAGRSKAKIAVGKPDGPSFTAKGEVSKDTAVQDVMFKTYAEKYGERWTGYEKRFREGLEDGSRLLIKYQPE